MSITRRGFLQGILAAGVAPAFVPSGVLMPVRKLWTPPAHWLVQEVRVSIGARRVGAHVIIELLGVPPGSFQASILESTELRPGDLLPPGAKLVLGAGGGVGGAPGGAVGRVFGRAVPGDFEQILKDCA